MLVLAQQKARKPQGVVRIFVDCICSLFLSLIKEEMGSISGIVAVWQLAGNFAGMIFIIATHQYDYHYAYAAHLVLHKYQTGS